jgi:large subunit ribosomal protein L20
MPRAKRGFKARRRRNKVLKAAKGYYGGRSKLIRTATEAVEKGLDYAFRHRRSKKRDFRALWNIRISAAAKECGTSYSKLISSLKKAGVALDRKVLADIAVNHPKDFAALVASTK